MLDFHHSGTIRSVMGWQHHRFGSHRGDQSTCAAFPHTAQVKAGKNRADGALDRRAARERCACYEAQRWAEFAEL